MPRTVERGARSYTGLSDRLIAFCTAAIDRQEEDHVRTPNSIWITAVAVAFATFAMAQPVQQPAPPPAKTIKHVPLQRTNAASGQEMYTSYCAVCHGTDGTGNGPAATALKVPPASRNELAQKNNGKCPAPHVSSVIRGEADLPAHGNKDMLVWGPSSAASARATKARSSSASPTSTSASNPSRRTRRCGPSTQLGRIAALRRKREESALCQATCALRPRASSASPSNAGLRDPRSPATLLPESNSLSQTFGHLSWYAPCFLGTQRLPSHG
jgi:mono/diheme cytochrome c family protein